MPTFAWYIVLTAILVTRSWIWAYWTFPLHYVMEGLVASQFNDDPTPITASVGSTFYDYTLEKNCAQEDCCDGTNVDCYTGTAEDWIYVSFGGMWLPEHIWYCFLYLCGAVLVAKVLSIWGLKQKNYLAK